jgi:dipeptidyl aminopeptidase/acylaminoacyl peptidase
VINCEFRGATGLGKEFTAKSNKTWGTDMTNDKADIAAWAVKNKIAKKDKVGIWGWSYGGYAAFAGLAFHPDVYACGISMYGISDIESFGKIGFANNDFWKTRVGDPFDDDEAKMLRDFSPINYIEKIKSPLLLTTGSKDERIPQLQMDSMASVLKNAGKDVIYFYYPEEVHDYRSSQSWMSFWAVGEQFLAGILGGRYEKKNNDIIESDMVVVEGKKIIEEMN